MSIVSQNYKYICFYFWNKTESAINPYQKEYLPVEGMLFCERASDTQMNIYYNSGVFVQLTHTKDINKRVITGFKNAFQTARTGMGSTEVSYDFPLPEPYAPPVQQLPPLYITNISMKRIP